MARWLSFSPLAPATILVERPAKALPLAERTKAREDAMRRELFIEPCARDVSNDHLLPLGFRCCS